MVDLFVFEPDDDEPQSFTETASGFEPFQPVDLFEPSGFEVDETPDFFDPHVAETAMAAVPEHLDTYDPENSYSDIAGDPEVHIEYWHHQETGVSCAVAAQMNILQHHFPDKDITEEELREIASTNGWYLDGEGTPPYHAGRLLEHYGLDVETSYNGSMNELEDLVDEGNQVIVDVESSQILQVQSDSRLDQMVSRLPGIPGQSGPDHAVQVIGFVTDEAGERQIVLNDPGVEYGQGLKMPVDEFENAWGGSTWHTDGPVGDSDALAMSAWPTTGGYYTSQGMFYCVIDGTLREPATGGIIRV